MKKSVKKTLVTAMVLMMSALCSVLNVSAEAQGWYCVRNKEHKQPQLDAAQRFIEEYSGYYVDRKYADESDEKVVYLTFDAGYENGNVEKILDTMKKEKVTGAFFILENLIVRNTGLVKRMVEEGHIVCNHTLRHKDMTKVATKEEFASELKALEDVYREYVGKEMSEYYRPPEGRFNEKTMKFADELGYKTIFWSLAYADWDNNNQPNPENAKKILLDNIHNGAVILLHPTSDTNAKILGDLIRTLKGEGYRFGTLDELVAEKGGDDA